MATFLMVGSYCHESLKGMSAQRTKQAIESIEKFDGKVQSMYATLGPNDLVLIVDFPDTQQAMKASVALTNLTGIAFSTSPAVTVEAFDKLMSE